ncbi:hypothetical protein OG953_35945 [Streptomyces sp. NBC_00057]
MDDHGVFEALVDEDFFQAHPASFGRLVQQGDTGLVVVRARGEGARGRSGFMPLDEIASDEIVSDQRRQVAFSLPARL